MYDDIYIFPDKICLPMSMWWTKYIIIINNDVNITSGIKTLTSKIEDILIFDRIH